MKNLLYIGQYTEGTTSRMRANQLNKILKPESFQVIDTHIPFYQANRVFQSLGFRYKIGPLIGDINKYVLNEVKKKYDLIWVDKGVYLRKGTTIILRESANKLVHYTPDCAFFENSSKLFNSSIEYFDYVITTKSFELEHYQKYFPAERIILTTQGYDKETHFSLVDFADKKDQIVFIGLYELNRGMVIKELLDAGLSVCLAGKKWGKFLKKNKNRNNLNFYGKSVLSKDYTRLISDSKFSLGLVSKRFPELHTTRTFEIPACGTALITERNAETSTFYNDHEAIFFENFKDMIDKIRYYQKKSNKLEFLTTSGMLRVKQDGRDYLNILSEVMQRIKIL